MGRERDPAMRGKSRPSSSSQAASLLQGSGGMNVGFGGYVGNSRIDAAQAAEDAYLNVDGETAANLRRLSKKDTTTKLKALNALNVSFQEQSPADISALLPCWVFEYKRLVYDSSRQIREATHKAMLNLVTAIGRSLAPQLKSLMGPWWVSHFDPFTEVSEAAKQSFQASFADPKRRLEALLFCATDIVSHIEENLKLTPQTISDKSTPIDESTEKYERVVATSLLALSALLDVILPSSDQHEKPGKLLAFKSAALDIFQSQKLFQAYFKSTSSGVRSAVYQSMQAYIRFAPEVISQNLEAVAKSVLGALGEKDPACHRPMWDMVLLFSRNHERAWEGSAMRKSICPRLWSLLRHGCYGSLRISYPCILPLLALIPASAISPAEGFFLEFFTNLWCACEEGVWSLEDGKLLIDTVKECLFWVSKNSQRYSAEQLQFSVVETVCLKLFFRTYTAIDAREGLQKPSLLLSSAAFIEQVGISVIDILSFLDEHLRSTFWTSFLAECSRILQQGEELPIERMTQFLVLLNDGRVDALTSVVKPFISKEFISIKESEQPCAVKLVSRLVSAYGPAAFATLASDNWAGTADEQHQETELRSAFSLKYLQYFFRKEIVPWCLSGEVKDLKLDLLLSFLEDDVFFKDWDFVLASIPEHLQVDVFASIVQKLQQRCQDGMQLSRWRSSRIDEAVLSVASGSALNDPSSRSLIRNALMGVGAEGAHSSILSNDAAVQLLEKLLNILASTSTNSVAETLLSSFVLARSSANVTFHAARAAIDVVLSCYRTILAFSECSETLAKVFAAMVCLYWAYVDPKTDDAEAEAEPEGDDELEVVNVPEDNDGEAEFVKSLVTAHRQLPVVCCNLSPACWRQMQTLLVTSIKEAVMESTEAEFGATRVLDLLKSACLDSQQLQATIDLLLAANRCWPLYVDAGGDSGSPKEVTMHAKFCSMVHRVGLGICLETLVLGEGEAGFRAWVIVELVCTWEWPGGSAREFVLPFLSYCAKRVESRRLVDGVLEELFLKSSTEADVSKLGFYCCWRSKLNSFDGYVRGLLAVLEVLSGDDGSLGKVTIDKVCVPGSSGVSLLVLPCVLDIVMPSLRRRNATEVYFPGGALQTVVSTWLKAALDVPLLSKCDTADDFQRVQVAVASFPVDINGGVASLLRASGAEVSQEERDCLLSLLRKQYPKTNISPNNDDFGEVRQLVLARLIAAAVCYCWESFGVRDWTFVLGQLRVWLQKGVIDAEEFTESVAEMDAGSEDFRKFENDFSLELLGTTLNVFSLVKALHSLEKAAESESLQGLIEAQWQSFDARATDNVLRLLLATGLAEAVAKAGGDAVSLLRVQQTYLWDQVATIALTSSDRVRDAAVRAANLWGLEKSAVSGLYALMFSPHPVASLQWVSYKFLSTDPLQHQAITWQPAGARDEPESENGEEKAPVSEDIRPELRAVLDTPASVLLESPLSSSIRIHYFLAWSLFLSHYQSLGTSSQAKDRLLEYTQDSDTAGTLLDCLFQHIGLKRITRKKDVIESSAVAKAANRAAATGSVSFAVEGLWGGGKDELAVLAGALYGFLLRVLPAGARTWYTGLRDKNTTAAVEVFTTTYCSSELLKEEFAQVQAAALSDESLTIVTNTKLLEITATYKKEETGMDMIIKFPTCYPLKPVEVECTRRMGISETLLRKWILSMVSFLRNQNGAVAEAILIWKTNVDHEFEGVEECPICYSILHTTNHGLPRLPCKTCKHKFHAACLYKWFSSSHKSNCPLCQTPF